VNKVQAGLVSCQSTFLKNITQIEHKIPIYTVYFLGVRGLTTLPCIVCGYTTSGHTELQCMYVVYIQFTYISVQYVYNNNNNNNNNNIY